jgi:hypothetical protein
MTTKEFQVCLRHASKCETQSESEAHLAVSPASLPGLPVELISRIAGYLDSASLHNLRNTTKWIAAAVDFDYTQRHPNRTVCRSARQLPGFLKQLTLPAINMHIKRQINQALPSIPIDVSPTASQETGTQMPRDGR